MIENVEQYFKVDENAFYTNSEGKKMAKSVHGKSYDRYVKAKEQLSMQPSEISRIIDYVNEFLETIGVSKVENPIVTPQDIDYQKIAERYNLTDERDIIWMKFTTSGFLGVVATSNDVGFDYPTSSDDYDLPGEKTRWKYTTSSILLHKLGQKWDERFVLGFPLSKDINCKYNRHQIELGIGKYLVKMGVPILDYYSHNYH